MGGDLRVRSVEGEGATCTVTLRRVVAGDASNDSRDDSRDDPRDDPRDDSRAGPIG